MKKETINPPELFNSLQYGFSQGMLSPVGKMVFLSGQVAWDENSNIVGPGDLATQLQQSIDNIRKALEKVGGTLADVVMLRIYVVNYQAENGPLISAALQDNFGTEAPPPSTWLSVQGLANEGFMVEIEAQAMLE